MHEKDRSSSSLNRLHCSAYVRVRRTRLKKTAERARSCTPTPLIIVTITRVSCSAYDIRGAAHPGEVDCSTYVHARRDLQHDEETDMICRACYIVRRTYVVSDWTKTKCHGFACDSSRSTNHVRAVLRDSTRNCIYMHAIAVVHARTIRTY